MKEILKTIQRRFDHKLVLIKFDPELTPFYLEEDEPYVIGNVRIADQYGSTIKTLELHETVRQALKNLGDDERRNAVCIIEPEARKIAIIPR